MLTTINDKLLSTPKVSFSWSPYYEVSYCVYQTRSEDAQVAEIDDTLLAAARIYADEGVTLKSHHSFWIAKLKELEVKVESPDCNYFTVIFQRATYSERPAFYLLHSAKSNERGCVAKGRFFEGMFGLKTLITSISKEITPLHKLQFGYCDDDNVAYCVYKTNVDETEVSQLDHTLLLAAQLYDKEGVDLKSRCSFWTEKLHTLNFAVENVDCEYFDAIFGKAIYANEVHGCKTDGDIGAVVQ